VLQAITICKDGKQKGISVNLYNLLADMVIILGQLKGCEYLVI
jgi:hypothetical protein